MTARPNPVARYLLVGAVCVVSGGVAGATSALVGGAGGVSLAVTAATAAVAMAAGIWACAWWWRGLDEAAREAHKWAWWWGATVGMAAGGVVLISLVAALSGDSGLADELARARPADLLFTGAGLLAGAQLLGYSVAWAAWWLRRR